MKQYMGKCLKSCKFYADLKMSVITKTMLLCLSFRKSRIG